MGDKPAPEWLYDSKGIPVARLSEDGSRYESLRHYTTRAPLVGIDEKGAHWSIAPPLRYLSPFRRLSDGLP